MTSPTPPPCVSIIVLNWNGKDDTLECIDSLEKLDYPNYEILIVDNGSTDGSVKAIRSASPSVNIIQTEKNLGFAGGNNVGIRSALLNGADYVWLLNNDTVVATDALTALVTTALSDPRIAFIGSKIYFHHKPQRIWYGGGTIELAEGGRTTHIGWDQVDTGQFDQTTDVGYVTGCSLLASKNAIETVGLIPEEYFLYFEETDWNIAAQKKGYRTVFSPKSHVWHKHELAQEYQARLLYYMCRNRIHIVMKYSPRHTLNAIKTNLSFISDTISKSPTKKLGQILLISCLAHLDALIGRFGKSKWNILR